MINEHPGVPVMSVNDSRGVMCVSPFQEWTDFFPLVFEHYFANKNRYLNINIYENHTCELRINMSEICDPLSVLFISS